MSKKNITIETLARMVEAGFREMKTETEALHTDVTDIRSEMATKLDVHDSEGRLFAAIETVRKAVEWNPEQAENLEEQIEAGCTARMKKLEARIERLEKRR